jgi:hypothetical protein
MMDLLVCMIEIDFLCILYLQFRSSSSCFLLEVLFFIITIMPSSRSMVFFVDLVDCDDESRVMATIST